MKVGACEPDPTRVSSEAPCTPLEFSVDLELPNELPLDVVVCTFRQVAHYGRVFFYGIVDWLDMQHGYRVKVRITRIEPEIFVAPEPGAEVERANPVVQAIARQLLSRGPFASPSHASPP